MWNLFIRKHIKPTFVVLYRQSGGVLNAMYVSAFLIIHPIEQNVTRIPIDNILQMAECSVSRDPSQLWIHWWNILIFGLFLEQFEHFNEAIPIDRKHLFLTISHRTWNYDSPRHILLLKKILTSFAIFTTCFQSLENNYPLALIHLLWSFLYIWQHRPMEEESKADRTIAQLTWHNKLVLHILWILQLL